MLARRRAAARAEPLGPTIGRGGRMSVPTPPVSLPRGTGQRRTAPILPFSGAETPPPLPGVRCRPAAGRGRRSAAGRGGSGSRCPDARNGREHRRSYRRLRSWWDAVRAATCQSPRCCGWERAAAARTGLLLMPRWLLVCCSHPCRRADGRIAGSWLDDGRVGALLGGYEAADGRDRHRVLSSKPVGRRGKFSVFLGFLSKVF